MTEREKELKRSYSKAWRLRNPDYQKNYHKANFVSKQAHYYANTDKHRDLAYKREFGFSLQEYNEMLKTQHGLCKICQNLSDDGRRLGVDHCHTTGVVRGLLCRTCNIAVGYLKDSPELARKLASYVENFTIPTLTLNLACNVVPPR